jgi:enamine deaminase RidA (YjgF/YER057c/UK114 family)
MFRTIILLTISNTFMTFAWYGNLKNTSLPLWKAILISWGIAFLEYCFMVPANRVGYISGLNGYLQDGTTMPDSFEEQGEIIWQHLGTILTSAGMDYSNLVSIRTYLADPSYDEANVQLRMKYLGDNKPALTVVCCQLLDPKWKLEVEAMAAK